uniref:cathepsin X n=1 Tax=Myxobolus cerebralis TaxID=59783 RepID=Q86GK0_9CNID|nr:cathepsin Z-like cysteine proteinase [Myxobolus cerebralis]
MRPISVIFLIFTLTNSFCYYDITAERKFRFANKYAGFHSFPYFVRKFPNMPKSFDWRENAYLSSVKNQHLPTYCGSCWAFASTSTIADRIYIAKNLSHFDHFSLSVQVVIACAQSGDCKLGGFASGVYEYALKEGIPDDTCSPYLAHDTECLPKIRCSTCTEMQSCFVIKEYQKYFIKDYSYLSGEDNIINEMFARGPLSCSMYASENFVFNYTGGVYVENSNSLPNHLVSILGWGEDVDEHDKVRPYWIIRNSWGTNWGEKGFFRIPRSSYKDGRYTLNIEKGLYFSNYRGCVNSF